MDADSPEMKRNLRKKLGRQRYRIAFFYYGRGWGPVEISRKIGIVHSAVCYHLQIIRRHRREIRQAFERPPGSDSDATDRLAA